MLGVHKAEQDVVRVAREEHGWVEQDRFPVTGLDAVYSAGDGRIVALTVDKARVAVEVTDTNAFPFRFYGVGLPPSETEFEYRIQFEPGVNTSLVCEQIEMAEEPGLEASAEGQFVQLYVDPTIGYEEEFCTELLKDLHKRFPIVEVVNMIINDTVDSDWQRWSVDQQEWPNEGPRFGHNHWTWAPQP